MADRYDLVSLNPSDPVKWESLVKALTLGGRLKAVIYETATVNPASLADGAGSTIAVTVAGAAVGDHVIAIPGADMIDVVYSASVVAANSVEVRVQNESASTRDVASSTWKFIVLKF